MNQESRVERQEREAAEMKARHLAERRLQTSGLLLLATVVLLGTVLYAGIGNVFLPGWWRLW